MFKTFQIPFNLLTYSTKCFLTHGISPAWKAQLEFSCRLSSSSEINRPMFKLYQKIWNCSTYHITIQRLNVSTYEPVCQHTPSSYGSGIQGNKDIDYVMERIKEKSKRIGGTLEDQRYFEIRKKLQILQKHGCIISHVPEFMSVLNLSEHEIQKRANKLKSAHMFILTPELFIENNETENKLKLMAYRQLEKITGLEKVEDQIQLKMECHSEEEWQSLKPYVCKTRLGVSSFFNKIDVFLAQGITLEELKTYPNILKLTAPFISSRMKALSEFYPFVNRRTVLRMFELDAHKFSRMFSEVGLGKYKEFFSNCSTAVEAANQLQIYLNQDIMKENDASHKYLETLKEKSSYLIGAGISPQCIVENIYCLKPPIYSLKRIVNEVKDKCGSVEGHEVMAKIFDIIKNNEKQKKVTELSLHNEISIRKQLGITEEELKDIQPYLGGSYAQKQILSKIDFLLEEGYSIEEILKHPQVLQKTLCHLQGRLEQLRKGDETSQPLIESLCSNSRWTYLLKRDVQNYRISLGEAKTKFDALADILEVKSQKIFVPLRLSENGIVPNYAWIQRQTIGTCRQVLADTPSDDNDLQGNKDLDYVMKRIVRKFKDIDEDMKEDRYSEIRQKLKILQTNGCVISLVPEFSDVLNLSVEEIEERAKKLQSAHMFFMTPELFIENNESLQKLKTIAYRQLRKITGLEKVEDQIRFKLECHSQDEWESIKPYVCKDVASVSTFFHKVDLFLANGITLEELKAHPGILKVGFKNFMSRQKTLNESFCFLRRDLVLRICGLDYYTFSKLHSSDKGIKMYAQFFYDCKTIDEATNRLHSCLEKSTKGTTNMDSKHLHSLQKKASYLIKVGISKQCIVENIYCLKPKFAILEKIVEDIKKQHGVVISDRLMEKIFETIEERKEFPSNKSKVILLYLKRKYKISGKELEEIQPYVGGRSAQKNLVSKIDFLLEEGYTINDIIKHPHVLGKSLAVLQRRLQKLRKGDEKSQPLIESLTLSSQHMKNLQRHVQNYRASLGNSKTKLEALSDMLDVQSKSVFDPIFHVKMDDLKLKIEYLLSIGITKADIVQDIFCLNLPLDLLKRSVQILNEKTESRLTLRQITDHANKSLYKHPVHCPSKNIIKRMLSLTEKETRKMDPRCLHNTTQVLQNNFKLMLDNGFTLESLKSCPYIIAHSTNILEEYLNELPKMKEIQIYEDLESDKLKLVNFLQYKIEKNHEFRKVVNDEEEILGVDQAKLSFYFSTAEKR